MFFSLPTTGAPEDVNLMGRVLAQDLKQLCDTRLRSEAELQPLLVIVDEFAALREASQFVDLMLQARQARMTLALATQVLPEEESIRKPALQSGLLVIHRLEAEDAEKVAAELGTHQTIALTHSPADTPQEADRMSLRQVDAFNYHPNEIKQLTKSGRAIVRSVVSNRQAVVQVSQNIRKVSP
jgi:hypothetical protein